MPHVDDFGLDHYQAPQKSRAIKQIQRQQQQQQEREYLANH
jgi:hypothetical protein